MGEEYYLIKKEINKKQRWDTEMEKSVFHRCFII